MDITSNTRAPTALVMHPQPSAPDMGWLAGLPHRDYLELTADDTAPRTARRRLAMRLPEWSLPEFEVVASVIASELVTNALVATLGVPWTVAVPPVGLWLRGGPAVVTLLAWDATVTAPMPRDAGDEDESGRGLAIIATLSARWGYYHPARMPGKVTWAIIDTP